MEATIRSVLEQDHNNLEYIIVDGGSSDDTMEIVTRYSSKISRIISEKDRGLYDALNKGISAATGEVIGFLHSDDFFIHDHVISSYAAKFMETGADAVYSDLYYVSRDGAKIVRKWKSGEYRDNSFRMGWMPPHPTFFVKKAVYERYGNFDLNFRTAADYELMLRFILKHRISLAYLHEFTIKMRVGGASNASLRNRVNANLEDRRAWKKNGLKPGILTLYLKPLRKLFQFF